MCIWQWKILRAGTFRLDGGSMFGIIPRALWSRHTPADDANRITLQTNCLLLTDGTRRVLIETGYGDKFGEKEQKIFALEPRSIVDALHEEGVAPEEIDHVVVSHLHFDHAGGLTHRASAADGTPAVSTFPNARIHTQKREWEDALANRSTMSRTYLNDHLEPVREQIECHEGKCEAIPGIMLIPAPGHTWGQHAVKFDDADGSVIFPGDVMPTAAHAGLPYNMAYDMEPFTNLETKLRLFRRCAAEGWRWVIDHEPGHPVVRIEADGDSSNPWRLVPVGSNE